MGYETPCYFVNENSEGLISEMMEYINKISLCNQDNLEETYQHIFDQLNELIDYYSNNNSPHPPETLRKSHINKIMLHFHINQETT